MSEKELASLIEKKIIDSVDLSNINIDGFNFSNCVLTNVIFSREDQKDRVLKDVNFKNCIFEGVAFDNAKLERCDFDCTEENIEKYHLSRVSFKNTVLMSSRFRKCKIYWSDFRYAEIGHVTFENAIIDFCDFYRSFFVGVAIFRKSKISNSSIHYTYFGDGSTIRRNNLVNGKILQLNKDNYYKFLVDWKIYGTGERTNNQTNSFSAWNPNDSIKARYTDAEEIYKNLNALWMSKGFAGDANWAYVQGKKMERKKMISELFYSKSYSFKIKNSFNILWNFLSDLMFGYGESMIKIIITYVLMIHVFAYFYYAAPEVSLKSYYEALLVSFKNMIAMSPEEVKNASPMIDFLNMVQTTVGILITGIFGFILGNKIRNQ